MANGKDGSKADQHGRFLETARQLGCDEDEAAFDAKLKAVVGPPKPGPVKPGVDSLKGTE